MSVDACAQKCVKYGAPSDPSTRCLGFEVYIDTLPATGNCYLFVDLSHGFFPLAPCATYLRINATTGGEDLGGVQQDSNGVPGFDGDTVALESPAAAAAGTGSYMRALRSAAAGHLGTPDHDVAIPDVFVASWQGLMSASKELGAIPAYRFDLVDVAREVIAANFSATLPKFEAAFAANDTVLAKAAGDELLAILDDYDLLLSSDTNFMLGRWLDWAAGWSSTVTGKAALDFNARNILTLWGPTGQIRDYAKKEWGGLVRSFYKPRYALFISMALECLEQHKAWDQAEYGAAAFTKVEEPWQHAYSPGAFPIVPETDLLVTSASLLAKYAPQ